MPTTNDRGLPLYSDSEAMPDWDIAYNAQSNALSTALDDSEQAQKDDDAVATIAALPVTGNWPGRFVMVEENDMVYMHDGTGFYMVGGKLPYFFGSRASSPVGSGNVEQVYLTTTDHARGVSMTDGILTFETVGIYRVHQAVTWEANGDGQRNLGILPETGCELLGQQETAVMPSFSVFESEAHSTHLLVTSPGATAMPYVTHNSGVGLDLYGSIDVTWWSA